MILDRIIQTVQQVANGIGLQLILNISSIPKAKVNQVPLEFAIYWFLVIIKFKRTQRGTKLALIFRFILLITT